MRRQLEHETDPRGPTTGDPGRRGPRVPRAPSARERGRSGVRDGGSPDRALTTRRPRHRGDSRPPGGGGRPDGPGARRTRNLRPTGPATQRRDDRPPAWTDWTGPAPGRDARRRSPTPRDRPAPSAGRCAPAGRRRWWAPPRGPETGRSPPSRFRDRPPPTAPPGAGPGHRRDAGAPRAPPRPPARSRDGVRAPERRQPPRENGTTRTRGRTGGAPRRLAVRPGRGRPRPSPRTPGSRRRSEAPGVRSRPPAPRSTSPPTPTATVSPPTPPGDRRCPPARPGRFRS